MPGIDQVWLEAARTLERGKPFALATVVNIRGSTPREVGAKMIVREDGQFGTIGGGCGEAEVFRKARMLLEEGGGARLTEVDLTGDFDQQQIGTCGGIMEVFVNFWSPHSDLPAARELAEAVRRSVPVALLTVVDPGERAQAAAGTRSVLYLAEHDGAQTPIALSQAALAALAERAYQSAPGLFEIDAAGGLKPATRAESNGAPKLFLDPLAGAQQLVIIGAGHIAQPLCVLGAMVGLRVTVIDDRPSFANRERFPAADEIIARPFVAAIDSLRLDRHSFVVVVTRGHAFDEACLRAVLKQQARYVGMIGSRRRVKATLDRIGQDRVPDEVLSRVHAPIGLDIGAETPEEIAVAIMAEMIRERRTGRHDASSMGVKRGRLKADTKPGQ